MQAGTITFLFTDIEASTRRWEADPTGMSAELARHDEILRTVVADHGGDVFKHTGDGICAAFPSAGPAVAAAMAAQRALAGGPLRARMAVHSGAAEQRDDDYFGPTLNRVARLMAAAHGGQIVVSAATAELARDDLPPDAALLDLGEHRLADLARPERVFQLNGEDADHPHFPPLRSLSTHRHNLPAPLTSFVGRERELGEIADLIKDSRLVTLAGVGGIGKTRLATEAAWRAIDAFPDGVFMVELASLADPELVPAAVTGALGLILDGSGSLVDQLAEYSAGRTTLLVLDNCEHMVDAVASLAETLLRRAPNIVVLATSREPLGASGEAVWRVPPLSSAEAVTLLCDRARAVNATYMPSEAEHSALMQISTRLDGIPLALELAAARLSVLSATEIADRLDDRFRLLTGGSRTALDRHRTLRAAVDWGYDLLDELSRALLRRLSVFVGGFDLHAAEAISGADTLNVLGGLVDRSWVAVDPQVHGVTRYRLTETIRQYAAEKLAEAGEPEEARRLHCAYYLSLCESTDGVYLIPHPGASMMPNSPAWLRLARLEIDNFRAALEWAEGQGDSDTCLTIACSLSVYTALAGHTEEVQCWLERGLAMVPDERSFAAVRGLCHLGFLFAAAADLGRAEGTTERALELAEARGDHVLEALAKVARGLFLLSRGETDQATDVLRSGFEQARLSAPDVAAWAAHNLGWAAQAVSDWEGAAHWFAQSQQLANDPESSVTRVHATAGLAPISAIRGDAERARQLASTAVGSARVIDLPLLVVMALTRAAETEILLGEPEAVKDAVAESLTILRDVGSRAWMAESLQLAAVVSGHRDRHAQAARLLGAAGALDSATGEIARSSTPGAGLARVRTQSALGVERFSAEFAAGESMTMDQALCFALDEVGGRTTKTGTPRV